VAAREPYETPRVSRGVNIALGRMEGPPEPLPEFAEGKGVYWEEFHDAGLVDNPGEVFHGFDKAFVEKVLPRSEPGTISFNLDTVNIARAMSNPRPAPYRPTITEWELRTLADNPNWLARTKFFQEGKPLTPEEVSNLGIRTSKNALKRLKKAGE
jgi:hypothetical protein